MSIEHTILHQVLVHNNNINNNNNNDDDNNNNNNKNNNLLMMLVIPNMGVIPPFFINIMIYNYCSSNSRVVVGKVGLVGIVGTPMGVNPPGYLMVP